MTAAALLAQATISEAAVDNSRALRVECSEITGEMVILRDGPWQWPVRWHVFPQEASPVGGLLQRGEQQIIKLDRAVSVRWGGKFSLHADPSTCQTSALSNRGSRSLSVTCGSRPGEMVVSQVTGKSFPVAFRVWPEVTEPLTGSVNLGRPQVVRVTQPVEIRWGYDNAALADPRTCSWYNELGRTPALAAPIDTIPRPSIPTIKPAPSPSPSTTTVTSTPAAPTPSTTIAPVLRDRDGDGIGDAADLCPDRPDPAQGDIDRDRIGDECDADRDGDGIDNVLEVQLRQDPDLAQGADCFSYWVIKEIVRDGDYANCNLAGEELTNSDAPRVDFDGADLRSAVLTNVRFAFGSFVEADLSSAVLVNALSLFETDFTDARLVGADLRSASLGGASLRGANLTDARLAGAFLADADLTGANLTRASLVAADLSGADLSGARLAGADLRGADLTGATTAGADVTGVIWR